jgi:hypothetical protein
VSYQKLMEEQPELKEVERCTGIRGQMAAGWVACLVGSVGCYEKMFVCLERPDEDRSEFPASVFVKPRCACS